MIKEKMVAEAARSMMEHGIDSPRRTDLIWKIRSFMPSFGIGHRTPAELINALEAAGLKLTHSTRR